MTNDRRKSSHALFGAGRLRSRGYVGIGSGLFVLGIIAGELPIIGGDSLLLGFGFAVLVAAANAYWNGGFLPGLGLAFAAALGSWWGPYVLPPTTPGIGQEGVIVLSVALAILTAFGSGLFGYAVGRLLRAGGSNWILDLLVGPNRTRTMLGVGGAIALFVLGVAAVFYIHEAGNLAAFGRAHAIRDYFRLADLRTVSRFRIPAMFAWVVLPAAYAYWNDGLIVDWALVFGLAYGYNVGFEATHTPDLGSILRGPLVQVLIHTFVLGTVGFLVGAGLRRLVERFLPQFVATRRSE